MKSATYVSQASSWVGLWPIGPRVVQFREQLHSKFQIGLSRDYYLNCTSRGPNTITNSKPKILHRYKGYIPKQKEIKRYARLGDLFIISEKWQSRVAEIVFGARWKGYIWQKKVYLVDITDIISFIILQSGLSALQNKEYSY